MSSFEKYNSISAVNNFVSNGQFQQKSGSFKVGTGIDNNHSKTLGDGKIVFLVGSAYTQGNTIRDLTDMSDSEPFQCNYVENDKKIVQSKYSMIFKKYPTLKDFPFLYPISDNWSETIPESSFRYSGKGLGKIEFYNSSKLNIGNVNEGFPVYLENYLGKNVRGRIPLLAAPRNITKLVYPTSGMVYSGNLMQYTFEDGFIKVCPYQSGRGIPQWDEKEEYFGGCPFGPPMWENIEVPISPCLAYGSSSSNNDFCIGVSLDSAGSNERVYKYTEPPDVPVEQKHTPWYDKPAPFTAEAKNISFTMSEKIFSPGPNLSDTYWAPWPSFYAYQENEEVPVLTSGKTTLKIGAATNIGMQAYYEPDVEEGDDPVNNPKYVSVSSVPLFQGEKVKIGTKSFSSAMGQVITWDTRGVSPYTPGSFCNSLGLNFAFAFLLPSNTGFFRDTREENPWYDWRDSTFGAIGWTSTPAFLLSGVPDKGVGIIETKDNKTHLPFMVQSNQGSVIVHASSVKNPFDEGGSGRMSLLGPAQYMSSNQKFEKIQMYPQQPGRCQTIGNVMQEIEGKGVWNYTGEYDFGEHEYVCGYGYETKVYGTSGGSGTGLSVNVTSVDSNGSITGVELFSLGDGNYEDGDIVTIEDNSINYNEGSLKFVGKSGSVIYNNGGISINYRGSGYISGNNYELFNISKNNLIMELTSEYRSFGANTLPTGLVSNFEVKYVDDPSEYPVGTLFYAMNMLSSQKYTKSSPLALFQVISNDGTTIGVNFYRYGGLAPFVGDRNTYLVGTYSYTTQKHDLENIKVTARTNTNGQIEKIGITDIGVGNTDGDLFLLVGGDGNCIVKANLKIDNSQSLRFIEGGAGYSAEQITSVTWSVFNNTLKINNPGGNYSNADMYLYKSDKNGTINKISRNYLSSYFFDWNVYTGTFGSIQTLEQSIIPVKGTLPSQPNGSEPSDGWDSFVIRKNATFIQESDYRIIIPGTGYSVGKYDTTGGSGTGLKVLITEIDDSGAVKNIQILEQGTGYLFNDSLTIVGGDCLFKLKIPETNSVIEIEAGGQALPVLIFDYLILEKGSGYTVSSSVSTTINNREGTGLLVNITEVDSDGGILELEIINPNSSYTVEQNIVIDTGDSNCVVQLRNPRKPKNITFTYRGTSYTTEENVNTYNLTQNNLYTIVNLPGALPPGSAEVFSYVGNLYGRPSGWDLSRYSVGDILSFNQGENSTATAEITSIDKLSQDITFTQLSNGVGYTTTSSGSAFLPTRNLSKASTTVDIVADDSGHIKTVSVNTLGDDVKAGDILLIEQGDFNCVVQIAPVKDVPPRWVNKLNGVLPTAKEWNDYKNTLKSSLNLLDYPVLVDFYQNAPSYFNNSYYTYGDEGITYDRNIGISPGSL